MSFLAWDTVFGSGILRDAEVAGSNPVAPIDVKRAGPTGSARFVCRAHGEAGRMTQPLPILVHPSPKKTYFLKNSLDGLIL